MARIGVEWVQTLAHPEACPAPNAQYLGHAVESFLAAMRSRGHDDVFNWGDDNARAVDFEHPDFGGVSLNWSDTVHFCCFGGHGGQFHFDGRPVIVLQFSLPQPRPSLPPCHTMSAQWRLGRRRLRWFLLDSCRMVNETTPQHVVAVWGRPMQGIHLILGFVDTNQITAYTYRRRVSFAFDICNGKALSRAWIDTAFGWDQPGHVPGQPIALAAGATREEAINRREHETLGWIFYDVAATNWLAWKWRA